MKLLSANGKWQVLLGSDQVVLQEATALAYGVDASGYLYLLIELQSSVDKYMTLRMMVYQGLLYQDLIKRGEVLADGRLPPVLPIVLYNGSPRWTAVTDVFELIPPVPGLVEQFKPRLKYLLIDENAYSDSELASVKIWWRRCFASNTRPRRRRLAPC